MINICIVVNQVICDIKKKLKEKIKTILCLLFCFERARRYFQHATDAVIREVITAWLTGSRDRDHGKK